MKWRWLMRNKWTSASAVIDSDFSVKQWEAGGVSMHLTLMFQLCTAQSQNQTGRETEKNYNNTPISHQRKAAMSMVNAVTWYSDRSKLTQEKSQLASDSFDSKETCTVYFHKPNKVYVTSDRSIIKITMNCSEAETFYTLILSVLRNPQCDVRHQNPSVSSNNKVLTVKK